MKRTLLVILALAVLMTAGGGFLFAGGTGEKVAKQYTFAYVMPAALNWYAYLGDAFEFVLTPLLESQAVARH